MRPSLTLAGCVVVALIATPLCAAVDRRLTVRSGTLGEALAELGRQAGLDIGSSDPEIDRVRIQGFVISAPPAGALDRLLSSTPFRAVAMPGGAFRIVRRPLPRHVAAAPQHPSSAPSPASAGDILVLAAKRDQRLSTYPGGTVVLRPGGDAFGPIGADGSHWLLARTPILQSTELGSGRNKLFIRGIADSSFTGPTQATASTYFGGVRIGYNGPDPNLNLYDVDQIEILEGPQGTLYGAGSIGGIILLNPAAPQLDRAAASAQIGASATEHGNPGYDAAAMVNVAPWRDRVAVRLVAYRSRQGGYISDPGMGGDLNPLTQTGGRVSVRVRPLDGLTVDASYLAQNSEQPDLQYANPGVGSLARQEALAQPFADHFRLARGLIEQRFAGTWTLRIAAARIDHDTEQRYDATRPPNMANPVAYDEAIDIGLTTLEAQLSRSLARGGGWLVGLSEVWDRTSAGRTFGMLSAPRDLIGVSNRTHEKAAYGEWTIPIGDRTAITPGVRYTSARMDGEPSRNPTNRDFIRGQTTQRVDPEFGFTHRFSPRLQWFGQYTQGFRTGGLAVARGLGRVASYESDHIAVGQTGLRFFRQGELGLSGYAEVSYARWSDIQADLVSVAGFPYTANVGDGRILTFEASADWAVLAGLRLQAAIVLNHSRLVDPQPEYASSGNRPLPASPDLTATGRVAWSHLYGIGRLRADLHMRYVGHSRLGVGPVLDIPYGDYAETGAAAAIARGRIEWSLGIENLFDTRGNRFAIGNPFAVALRNEATPLRPRTIRIGLSTAF